ncbi:MAG: HAD-IC family P-type ATPase, partial [Ghiorsea sp.]|nr:HAD-IC family P-type ATPase [Ghiorsea sp.]
TVGLVAKAEKEEQGHFQKMVIKVGDFLIAVTVVLIGIIIWHGVSRGEPLLDLLIFALILTISAIPVAMPAVLTVTMALGARVLATKEAIVTKLSAIEEAAGLDILCSDKTGTLTRGQLQVQNQQTLIENPAALWAKVHALERASEHPLADAISKTLQTYPANPALTQFENVSGRGVQGYFNGGILSVGSLGWLLSQGITIPENTEQQLAAEEQLGHTLVVIFDAHQLLAWVALGDELRPEASDVINTLQQQGIGISLLTGDREGSAKAIVSQLKTLKPIQVIAEVLPHEKADKIKSLQAQGLAVGMIGDGVNDAPALTQANVGIAMGQATDISAHAADVVLLGGLDKLPTAFTLSKQTMRTIKQNLAISLGYNILVIPLAMSGMIHPLFAAIAMPVSSLLVIGNALLIHKRVKG